MSDLTSKVLGPIDLDGGPGGGAMECDVPMGSRLVPTRLEIDHPGRLDQKMIDDLDVVLEHLDIPDRLAREAIGRAVLRDGTAPHSLFTSWTGRRQSAPTTWTPSSPLYDRRTCSSPPTGDA